MALGTTTPSEKLLLLVTCPFKGRWGRADWKKSQLLLETAQTISGQLQLVS